MRHDFSLQRDHKLPIKEKTITSFVGYNEIIFLQCSGNLVFVYHTLHQTPYSYSISLAELETTLTNFGFVRINHNVLINLHHVLHLNTKKRQLQLTNGNNLTVSRRKWQKIKEFFNT